MAFLGTPASAVPALEALVAAGHEVMLVVSRPDRRRGRGPQTSPSPVKQAAVGLGIPVTDRLGDVVDAGAELGVVVAYGRLIPVAVLERVPMLNVHFSLLPRWRGAAPVERAILAGDTTTGVCLMRVEEGLDTGPVYAQEEVRIGASESADQLRARLAELGASLLTSTLAEVRTRGVAALPEPVPQEGEATYAAKIEPSELVLDWRRPAADLERVIRVGRAWTTFRGRRLVVRKGVALDPPASDGGEPGTLHGPSVTTGRGSLQLIEVQPEGSRPMAAADWLRGARPVAGEQLGQNDDAP